MSFAEQNSLSTEIGVRGAAELKPTNRAGAWVFARCGLLTTVGLGLSASGALPAWFVGQVLLAVAFLQWFILLHEAGHLTLFRSRGLNIAAGHIAGFFAVIPFESWRRVHGLHHVWTGWQDLDPTTAPLVPRPLRPVERLLLDWAWKLWFPLFSVLYRVNNYWRPRQLDRLFPAPEARRAVRANVLLLASAYAAAIMVLGITGVLWHVGLALLLTLVLQDPLILSQHTHIQQNLSEGRRVQPIRAAEQGRYTRSLRFPLPIAQGLLINFNEHELHHRHVHVPGYRLGRIAQRADNTVDWWVWLREAKRLPGSVFLFSNRERTGFRW